MLKASIGTAAARSVTGRKFALLFLFLLAYLVFFPYAPHAGSRFVTFRVFGAAITLLSIYAVSFRRGIVLSALVLAIPALVQRIVLPEADAGVLPILGNVLSLAFDVLIVVTIFRRVFLNAEPTRETIYGALCIYLLAGFSFANLYAMLAAVQPRAFYLDPGLNANIVPDRFDFIYYSFANLTCVGAAGITPASDQARSFSVIESVVGVLYLAVLISRLLSAYHARNRTQN